MMKDYFYLSKLMHEAMEFLTEEQIQKLLNKHGQLKITYEDVEKQTPVAITSSKPEIVQKAEKKEVKKEVKKIKEVKQEKETKQEKEVKPKTTSKAKQKTESVIVETNSEEKTIINKLNTLESESEARKYLNDLKLNKTQLQALLEYCKIPAPKSSTISDMKKRLVDSEVSSRLRSSVILNTNVGSRK